MENIERLYDAIVVGGGPAGLTAALYLARARYRVLVIEKDHFGGQITITAEVVNYPGVGKTSGTELTETMRKQAESFGAEFLLAEVTSFDMNGDVKTVHTSRGDYNCFSVLLATGAHPRQIGFKGEAEFKGRGVAYCATCDGEFFTGKDVFVVGGGFAAAEESVFLTKYAKHVTILIRESDFTCAKATAEAARKHEKITVLTNTQVEEIGGDDKLRFIRYRNDVTGEVTEYSTQDDTFGVFVFAGYEPATELIKDIAERNEQSYVLTDRSQKTTANGLYAAGDVCVKPLRQVVTAVGDGALAATEMERLAATMQQKTGLKPKTPVSRLTQNTEKDPKQSSTLFTEDMLAQLEAVFAKMINPLILRLYLDDSDTSQELKQYMEQLSDLTEKLTVEIATSEDESHTPCVRVYKEDGSWSGLAFHGVPGGHEFTSFVLGLYNVSGPSQALDEKIQESIKSLNRSVDMQILVSLSCTLCPDLVTAAQRIAAENANITAQVYDLNHFLDLKERYQVMSVPCLVINQEEVYFGKKDVRQLLEILAK